MVHGERTRSAAGQRCDNLPFRAELRTKPPLPEGVLQVDFNYDFKTDLVLAGAGGVRLMRQDSPDKFTDVTAQTKLPKAMLDARYTGAWAVDIEADGDLDIVMGAKEGAPLVLRNNGDGTFTADSSVCAEFPACADLRGQISTGTAIPTRRSSTAPGGCTCS